MKNVLLQGSLSLAISCLTAGMLFASGAQPPPSTPSTPKQQPPASAQQADDIVTATGCLKQEKDVPGAKPNVAEKAGVGEDFILTQAKLKGGSATGTSARAGSAMYKIEGLDDEKLRTFANQQVEVRGRLETKTVTGGQKPTTPTADTRPDEVQSIRASSIKMIASTCSGGTN